MSNINKYSGRKTSLIKLLSFLIMIALAFSPVFLSEARAGGIYDEKATENISIIRAKYLAAAGTISRTSYTSLDAYGIANLLQAGIDPAEWKYQEKSLETSLDELTNQTLASPENYNAKEIAYLFRANHYAGKEAKATGLLDILTTRHATNNDGTFFNGAWNQWTNLPVLDILARTGKLGGIDKEKTIDYLLALQQEDNSFTDFQSTAQAVRILHAFSRIGEEYKASEINTAISEAKDWLKARVREDGRYIDDAGWDDPITDSAEIILTQSFLGEELELWKHPGSNKTPADYLNRLNYVGANIASNAWALEAFLELGAEPDLTGVASSEHTLVSIKIRIEGPVYTILPETSVTILEGTDYADVLIANSENLGYTVGYTTSEYGKFIDSINDIAGDPYWLVQPWKGEGYYAGDSFVFSGNGSTQEGSIVAENRRPELGETLKISVRLADNTPVAGARVILYSAEAPASPELLGFTDENGELFSTPARAGRFLIVADKKNTAEWPEPDNGLVRTKPVEIEVLEKRELASGTIAAPFTIAENEVVRITFSPADEADKKVADTTGEIAAASSESEIKIAAATKISGPADWDGKLKLPKLLNPAEVTVEGAQSVDLVIEVGSAQGELTFDKPVRILLKGQAGKSTGFLRGSSFTEITKILNSDSGDELSAGEAGKIDVGGDLVIWTTHFTKFVSYVKTGSPGGGGGIGGTGIEAFISVRGKNDELFYSGAVNLSHLDTHGITALGALHKTGLSYAYDSPLFIHTIAGQANEGLNGWMYKVNGIAPSVPALQYNLSTGDAVEWYYSSEEKLLKKKIILALYPGGEEPRDEEILDLLSRGKELTLSLEDAQNNTISISGEVLDKIIEKEKKLYLINQELMLELDFPRLFAAELLNKLKDTGSYLEFTIRKPGMEEIIGNFNNSNNDALLKSSLRYIEISFNKTYSDNSTFKEKITEFIAPMLIKIDINGINFEREKAESLTGLRIIQISGNTDFIRLGGDFDEQTGKFSFYTDRLSLYGVAQKDNLRKIVLTVNSPQMMVNDKLIPTDAAPQVIEGRTFVSLRFVAEALGAEVEWDNVEKQVEIYFNEKLFAIKTGNDDISARLIDSRSFVPLRYVSESFGAGILYFKEDKKIMITY